MSAGSALVRAALPADPLDVFAAWYRDADDCEGIRYTDAAFLATVSPLGYPEGRIVLLHGFGPEGFTFFTDRRSAKGRSLEANPRANLTFYWGPLERQVSIQGSVEPGTDEEADGYFARRPRRSQVTTWACAQSSPVESRAHLEELLADQDKRFRGLGAVPRPPDWKAYRLLPETIELWQARARRLHDRILYRRSGGGGWRLERLAP